jgi:ring-1,2-phenylacetyl-CoA epoxidase subunit PaaE
MWRLTLYAGPPSVGQVNAPLRAATGPRSALAERFETFRRDASTVLRDLMGRSPPPSSRRGPLARHLSEPVTRPSDLLAYRSLRVDRVVRETRDAVSLHLSDPDGAPISFTPGQFFTLLVTLPGGPALKRAYSLSALPGEGESACRGRITIKRIAQGQVSNHLVEHAREGDVVTVLGPSGNFGISAEEARGKHLLLVGGGSGITPLRCILEARLADPSVVATLLYGNRSEQDIIFHAEIEALARAHAGRLLVRHVLEAPAASFPHGAGRLDRATATLEIQALLGSDFASGRTTEVLVCGPTPMMEAVREVLGNLGVARERVREEQFTSPDQRRPSAPTRPQQVTFTLGGRSRDTIASAGQTLLEAGLAAGLKMPFSCAMGGCGACKVKLVSGSVVADEPNCLSAEEQSRGHVLTCVSRAAEAVTLEVP